MRKTSTVPKLVDQVSVTSYTFPSSRALRKTFFANQLAVISLAPFNSSHRELLTQNLFKWLQSEMDSMYHFHFVSHTCLMGDLIGARHILTKMTSPFLNKPSLLSKVREMIVHLREQITRDLKYEMPKSSLENEGLQYNLQAHKQLKRDMLLNMFNRKFNARVKFLLKVRKAQFEYKLSVHTFFNEMEEYLNQARCVMGEKFISNDMIQSVSDRRGLLLSFNRQNYMTLISFLEESYPSLDDFRCPICLNCLCKPITIVGCKHKFCEHCIKEYQLHADIYHLFPQMPMDHRSCPLCRAEYNLENEDECVLDESLENFLKLYFPKELEESRREKAIFQRRKTMERHTKMIVRKVKTSFSNIFVR